MRAILSLVLSRYLNSETVTSIMAILDFEQKQFGSLEPLSLDDIAFVLRQYFGNSMDNIIKDLEKRLHD